MSRGLCKPTTRGWELSSALKHDTHSNSSCKDILILIIQCNRIECTRS